MNIWDKRYNRTIQVQADSFCQFNNNIHWIGLSNSFILYQIKNEFEALAQQLNINLLKDQFNYTPHITIAFNAKRIEPFNTKFDPIDLNINSIILWGYDEKIRNAHISSALHIINMKG